MPDPIVVPLSDGQSAAFRDLAERARLARRELDVLPELERIMALSIVLGAMSADQAHGARLHVDLAASSITVTLRET